MARRKPLVLISGKQQEIPENSSVQIDRTEVDGVNYPTNGAIIGNFTGELQADDIAIGTMGYAKSTGDITVGVGHAIGTFGLAEDNPDNDHFLIGVEGRVNGQAVDKVVVTQIGALGYSRWQAPSIGADFDASLYSRVAMGVNGRAEVFENDGTTPLEQGILVNFFAPLPIGGAVKYSFLGYAPGYFKGGVIFDSPDGTKFPITVDNDGNLLGVVTGGGDIVSKISNVVNITANTTLDATYFGKELLINISSDITIDLVAISGHTDKQILFVITETSTGKVTLQADGSETINGVNSRIMWMGETALLQVTSTEWVKVAGRSVPAYAEGTYGNGSSTYNYANVGGDNSIPIDTVVIDPLNCINTGSDYVVVPRDGRYTIIISTSAQGGVVSTQYFQLSLEKNTAPGEGGASILGVVNNIILGDKTVIRQLEQGDNLRISVYTDQNSYSRSVSEQVPRLILSENLTW